MGTRNAFYAQSGGVSAVINASACAVLQTARQHTAQIGKVYAGRDGIIGALSEDLIDTSLESEATIAALKHTRVALSVPVATSSDRFTNIARSTNA
jgi:6-phosphofructokinase